MIDCIEHPLVKTHKGPMKPGAKQAQGRIKYPKLGGGQAMNPAKAIAATCIAMGMSGTWALDKTEKVYRCEKNGRVEYTESPCLDAKEVDVTPTKGAETYPSANLKSQPLQRERTREQVIEGIRPITGMDQQAFKKYERRAKLTQDARNSCAALDKKIPEQEAKERIAQDGKSQATAADKLFTMRNQYKSLKC